ncbi:hypothetical protein M405DRAFT_854634 [Rhizopogon salebrosus TDB-379]|nr:hypothetical protein M405DRAFT_854634 [Rhizopogon salebrosus TDB-379]
MITLPPRCDSRTLWNIIWSCAATLFACTWTAIHPNIPGVDEGKLAVTSRRLLIMIMVLVVPELIIAWAARQFFSAYETAFEFNQWTVTHGFFGWMGGFLLYVDDHPRATLTPDELRCFIREGSVDMPGIGDALSKGVAILQLGWFVLQLVVRYIQNLPITLLEVDTLAVAALTSTAYGWWWKKPKDMQNDTLEAGGIMLQ